ncbi:MAG: sensor histidine kinase, partial [Candidatus Hydrogenedens sp.]
RERQHNQQVFVERGQTLLQILSSSLSLQTRMGCYRAQRVVEIINSVSLSPGILYVALLNHEGKIIASAGETSVSPINKIAKGKHIYWDNECVCLSQTISMDELQKGRQHRYGMAVCPDPTCANESMIPWSEWGTGPFLLMVCLNTQELKGMNKSTSIRFGIFALLSMGISILGFVVLELYQRKESYAYDLKLTREKARYNEHLAQIGAGLAHETKNPLGIVRGLAQAIQEEVEPISDAYKYASKIIDETDRSVRQINNFLELTHPHTPEKKPISLQSIIEQLLNLTDTDIKNKGISIEVKGTDITIEADPEYLRRALLNLLLNAIQACSAGDKITLQIEPLGDWIALHIIDTGVGISAEDLPHVVKPYYSKRKGGTGLGLSIVNEIVLLHGWEFSIQSQKGEGTKVTISHIRRINS